MALPLLARTYQYTQDLITTQGSANATAKLTLLTLKNRLIGFGSAPLTVLSSSNGVTASAADNWATVADVISGSTGAAQSWFRFGIPEIHANFQMVISCRSSSAGATNVHTSLELVISPTVGFTGGTATARPTAVDEIIVDTPGAWVPSTNVQHNLYVQRSTNGRGLRVFVMANSLSTCCFVVDRPETAESSWTNPTAAFATKSSNTNVPTTLALNSTGVTFGRGNTGVTMTMYCSYPYFNNGSLMARITAPFSYTASYPMPKIRIVSETALNTGDMGVLDDIWWAPTTTAVGDTFPNDTSRQFVQVGNIILPHSGSVVNIS